MNYNNDLVCAGIKVITCNKVAGCFSVFRKLSPITEKGNK